MQNAQASGRASSAPCHSVWQLRLPTCQHHDDKPLVAACRICQPESELRHPGGGRPAWNRDLSCGLRARFQTGLAPRQGPALAKAGREPGPAQAVLIMACDYPNSDSPSRLPPQSRRSEALTRPTPQRVPRPGGLNAQSPRGFIAGGEGAAVGGAEAEMTTRARKRPLVAAREPLEGCESATRICAAVPRAGLFSCSSGPPTVGPIGSYGALEGEALYSRSRNRHPKGVARLY